MYTINPKILQTPIADNNILLLEPDAGLYFELNETSVLIYQAMADGLEIKEILDKLTGEYQISLLDAQADMTALIKQLLDNNIISSIKEA